MMPKLSPGQPFGPIPATVVLDASGNGTVAFQATGSPARVTNLFGKVSTATNQAVVSVYLGTISDTNRVFNNNSGSTGFTAQGQIDVPDGTVLYVVWTGGDVGATAIATFSGRAIPFAEISGGFEMRADDPIAAGDGSLIFPALRSPNYVAGVSGWKLDRNGNFEANNAVFRGTFSAANGLVTIDNGGLAVVDSNSEYEVNRGSGFIGRPIPNDGREVILAYNGLFIHVEDPSPINGLSSGTGDVTADIVPNGGTEFPRLRLSSPEWNGFAQSILTLWGEGSNGTRTYVDFSTNTFRMNQDSRIEDFASFQMYEKKVMSQTRDTDIAMTTAGPIQLFAFPSFTYLANRAYKVKMYSRYDATATGLAPLITVRKTNTAGAVLVDQGRLDIDANQTNRYKPWESVFIVGNSDVTAVTVICGQSVTANVTQTGSGTTPSFAEMYEVGSDFNYPGFGTLT